MFFFCCTFYRDIEQSFWDVEAVVEDIEPVIITSDSDDDDEDSDDEDAIIMEENI